MKSIEFFHNVVCSYCFVQSKRLRELFKEDTNLDITHRSFPLRYQKDKEAFPYTMYGSDEEGIINHWEAANRIDEDHRFNIEGMREKDFDFPTSRLAEIAIQAAVLAEGEEVHWDIFDHFQNALFVRNLNISDDTIVRDLIKETPIDYQQWKQYYEDEKTEKILFEDYEKVEEYKLNLIPALVLEEEEVIKGAIRPKLISNKMDDYFKNE